MRAALRRAITAGRLRGQDGFTLVEALVAFAIVAAISLVLQRGLVQSRSGLAAAADREAAEWLVRDLLATPLTRAEMKQGGRTGVIDGRRYEIRLSPIDPAQFGQAAPGAPSEPEADNTKSWIPVRERIEVETARNRIVSVETIKLGPIE